MNILKIMGLQLLIIIPFVLLGLFFISFGTWWGVIVGCILWVIGVVYSATFGTRRLEKLEEDDR